MAPTPLTVPHRPFAVEPITGIMIPDGIFDAAIFFQHITCQVRNTADRDLIDVTILFEGISDPGVIVSGFTHHFPRIPAGAAVTVSWRADFRAASPGKPIVSIVAQEVGNDIARSLKRIFVSRTTYDETTGKFTCAIPEGRLEVTKLTAFGPDSSAWKPKCAPDRSDDHDGDFGPWLPASFDAVFVWNPPYPGTHGELPFNDPWWKIIAVIVAVLAAITAVILAATSGGTAFVGIQGTFDETGTIDPAVSCCEPDWKTVGKETGLSKAKVTGAAVASIVATAAIAVAFLDEEDPWWRGQKATPPARGELTLAESVSTKFEYLDPPNAGTPYRMQTSWTYRRHTTTRTLEYSVEEVQENTHLAEDVAVEAPSPINAFSEPLSVRARFSKPGGEPYSGVELFVFALVISPDGEFGTVIPLHDDGIAPDKGANDALYTGAIHLEPVFPIMRKHNYRFDGRWRVLVFAQDVNLADEADMPEVQAKTVGGIFITSPIQITFDTNLPCPITAQASVEVLI